MAEIGRTVDRRDGKRIGASFSKRGCRLIKTTQEVQGNGCENHYRSEGKEGKGSGFC